MNTTSIKFSEMTKIQKYQHFTRRKFQEVENVYYPYLDELESKLDDLGEFDTQLVPDFTIYQFSFLKDWQNGDVDSAYVCGLMAGMNFNDVAEKQLTRRLTNMMIGRENRCPQSCDYIKAVRDALVVKGIPLYVKYLEMLFKYFQKMDEIDREQVRITWLEQIFRKNGEIVLQPKDVTLNQAFRELDSSVIPHNDHKYMVGENLIVFDEDLGNEDLACHWIFGPKSYIKHLREQFNVTEYMSVTEEKEYIKKLIGNYVK